MWFRADILRGSLMAVSKTAKSAAVTPAGGRAGASSVKKSGKGKRAALAAELPDVSDAELTHDDASETAQAMHKSIGWALTVLARLHRVELGERLAALGLFPGQEQLLQALHDNETMTMGALAELMQVRPPTASKAVARLSAQGLVERADGAAGDGRLVRVRLTDEGYARAATLAALWSDAEQRLLDGFDQRDRKKLRKLLRRAVDNFRDQAEGEAQSDD